MTPELEEAYRQLERTRREFRLMKLGIAVALIFMVLIQVIPSCLSTPRPRTDVPAERGP